MDTQPSWRNFDDFVPVLVVTTFHSMSDFHNEPSDLSATIQFRLIATDNQLVSLPIC